MSTDRKFDFSSDKITMMCTKKKFKKSFIKKEKCGCQKKYATRLICRGTSRRRGVSRWNRSIRGWFIHLVCFLIQLAPSKVIGIFRRWRAYVRNPWNRTSTLANSNVLFCRASEQIRESCLKQNKVLAFIMFHAKKPNSRDTLKIQLIKLLFVFNFVYCFSTLIGV